MSLHTLNKADPGHPAARCCLSAVSTGDALLLIEDGCYALLRDDFTASLPACIDPARNLYALAEDLAVRGISDKIPSAINVIDYTEFVGLCLTHDRVINW